MRLSPFSLAVFSLAQDLSFDYGPSLAFAKNTAVLQSTVRRTKPIFLRRKKRRAFTINLTSVPGFRAIGGGDAAALKVFSFLGLSPINKNSRIEQICIPPEKYSVFPPRTA